jgi:putative PIN family toxin of toxin-antitoxin system
MKRPVRAVLDTNIVLSALLFASGRLAPIRFAWQRSAFRPLLSRATTEELIRTLGYPKFALTDAERDELLADYLPYCTVVTIPANPPTVPRCRDPFDPPFLHLAAHGKADYLVTGDRDLLALQGQLRCAIVTAEAFQSALDLR